MVGDQIGEHLGVRLRLERVVFRLEKFFDRHVVLDHPVVHDGELAIAGEVRVGVGVRHAAMRGPTRVADAASALERMLGRLLDEVVHPARFLGVVDATTLQYRQARGIIAAIFEPLQSFEEDGSCLVFAHVADDSAHIL